MRMVARLEARKSPYTPGIRPYYFRVYGRILQSIRQEYYSNTSSILTNTLKSVDCHTHMWVHGTGFVVF